MPVAKKKTTKRVKTNLKGLNVPTTTEDIDVPPHLRGGDWKRNFEKKPISLTDKITWVLTVVNVIILISLVIRNV